MLRLARMPTLSSSTPGGCTVRMVVVAGPPVTGGGVVTGALPWFSVTGAGCCLSPVDEQAATSSATAIESERFMAVPLQVNFYFA